MCSLIILLQSFKVPVKYKETAMAILRKVNFNYWLLYAFFFMQSKKDSVQYHTL